MSIHNCWGKEMFILDVYRFCESSVGFTWRDLGNFVYRHRECERLARQVGVTRKFFAESVSREFFGRMATLGYLSLDKGVACARSALNRPFDFEFRTFKGEKDKYVHRLMHIEEYDDEEFFAQPKNG